MTNDAEAFKAIELKLVELNLKPGAKLGMIVPENWSPRQIAIFSEYANLLFRRNGYGFELICFPHGAELIAISPDAGFK